eukprot:TRINITY_DN4423_c0_g1_i2.p1 TRINITY_DN4423_c0_g1~~TRINITY_DN4423_c0_g1_i2.p1  ORF type:complete len:310 (+),score=61.19 TRINITY_DN4423_c0_g1_i2:430-1359(+)
MWQTLCRAEALYDYEAGTSAEFSFQAGDQMNVIKDELPGGWWLARRDGQYGHVPGSFFTKVDPEVAALICRAKLQSSAGGRCQTLSLGGGDVLLTSVPPALGVRFGAQCTHLDLSFNHIVRVAHLERFTCLESLVLDNNELQSAHDFPELASLRALSLNNNHIADLGAFLDSVAGKLPRLSFLSLVKNPCCPLLTGDDAAYTLYRLRVLYRLRQVTHLDSLAVSQSERGEVVRRGDTLIIQPAPNAASLPVLYAAVALYDYVGTAEAQLSFQANDTFVVHQELDLGWLLASRTGQLGHVPAAYVRRVDA